MSNRLRLLHLTFAALAFVSRLCTVSSAVAASPMVSVEVAGNAPALEQFAAQELCRYLKTLFQIDATPTTASVNGARFRLFIGSAAATPALAQVLSSQKAPALSEQGLLLKPLEIDGAHALLITGGSPRATLWAVYELVERWGVRYLLQGDVLPRDAGQFRMPTSEVVMEPNFPVRQWRVINAFASGPEAWGIEHYRPVIDQLAKLKFSRVYANFEPWQAFIDLQYGGVKRKETWLWYNLHYPITPDMPGRQLMGDRSEWWNPDLPLGASYEKFAAAGERHAKSILSYAKSRGMEVAMTASLTEFPREFAGKLKDSKSLYDGLGNLTVTAGTGQPIDDPDMLNMAAAVLQTTLDTYPDVDFIVPSLPEIPHWTKEYAKAWKHLNDKYKLDHYKSADEMIALAGQRHGYAGGLERAVTEVKSNIIALYLLDRLISEQHVFDDTKRPDARLVFNSMAEEVLPVLPYALPKGSETLNLFDYTPDRIVARPGGFKLAQNSPMRHSLVFTMHDDNVGLLPMLNTNSLAELSNHMRDNGWAGFSTRYWITSDHDACIEFISRRAWDDSTTPDEIYRDQTSAICGDAVVDDMLQMFHAVEKLTVDLNQHGMGLTFPLGRSMIEQHRQTNPIPQTYVDIQNQYRQALSFAEAALPKSRPEGRSYIERWIGRLKFGIGYFDVAIAMRKLTSLTEELAKAEKTGDADALSEGRKAAGAAARDALETARQAIEAYANVARDQSDRGAIAVLVEGLYRPLQDEVRKYSTGGS